MLHDVKKMHGYKVGARDGELGTVKDAYFDDRRWAIRYAVVETGSWLSGRKVLISPNAIQSVIEEDDIIRVNLTQQQVKGSPGIDTDKPVSRQHEIDHSNYYGLPYYWEGNGLWGMGMFPMLWDGSLPDPAFALREPGNNQLVSEDQGRSDMTPEMTGATGDPHLHSCNEVIGYEIMATDGPIGSVENFVFDDKNWAIRYLIVNTHKWLPGKHVQISPQQIERVSWSERDVFLNLTREAVEVSPEYETA